MTMTEAGAWRFEDAEEEIVVFVRDADLDYEKRRPLAALAPDCARRALEYMGLGYRDVADLVDYHYQTVAGWFRPGRNLTRSVVAGSLFPALCEAYVRSCEPANGRLAVMRRDYLDLGGDIDDALRLETERRVAMLLCTGEAVTSEERRRAANEGKRSYYRALLRFGASYLDDEELADAAHDVLALLSRHARRPSQKEDPDELTKSIEQMGWALWREMADELAVLERRREDGAEPWREASMQLGATIIGDTADKKRYRDMDPADFRFARELLVEYESYRLEGGRVVSVGSGIDRLNPPLLTRSRPSAETDARSFEADSS